MVEIVQNMDARRRTTFFLSLGLILAVVIGIAVWAFTPKYQPVFSQLDESTAASAIAKLEEQGVPYKVRVSAQLSEIAVPEALADKLKVTLGKELGLPEVQGLELFDNADYGMTDFSQDVTYKRAIQGELARTIATMPGVKSARVHVTFAPKRLFKSEQQQAKASVYIEESELVSLVPSQINGIKKLVANAIEMLQPNNVAVFDGQGVELGPSDEGFSSQIDKKYEAKLAIEQDLTEKAYRLITLSIPEQSIAVAIDATLNFDQRKMTKQGYADIASSPALIVREKESSTSKQMSEKGSEPEPMVSSERETEFTHGREMEETVYSAGEIEQLSVAVAIREPLSEDQIASITSLLTAGMGLDLSRGDQIAVEVLNAVPSSVVVQPPVSDVKQSSEVALVKDSVAPTPVLASTQGDLNYRGFWVMIAVVMALILVAAALLHRRKKRLSLAHREQLLMEIQDWLNSGESCHVEA